MASFSQFKPNAVPCIKKHKRTLIWAISFFAVVLFLIWRAPYGYCYNDEGAFLSIPYRLSMGDSLIKHEWHVSQIADIVIYPFFLLYRLFTGGSTDGIVLSFRYISIALKCLVCIYIYFRVKRTDPIAAIFASLCPMLGLSLVIQTVSYDTNGCLLLLLCMVTISTMDNNPHIWEWLFSGACFACAVLTCPLYLAAWLLFLAMCFAAERSRRNGGGKIGAALPMLSMRGGIYFTCGCAVVALPFFIFLFSQVSVGELIEYLPMVLSDPDHVQIGLYEQTRQLAIVFLANTPIRGISLILLTVLAYILGMVYMRRRPSGKYKFVFSYAYVLIAAYGIYVYGYYWAYISIPLFITGMLPYIMLRDKKIPAFLFLYCGGLLFGALRHYTSNLQAVTMIFYLCMSVIAVFIFIFRFIRENKEKASSAAGRIGIGLMALLPVAAVGIMAYSISTSSFEIRDGDMSKLHVRLTHGPLSGLITTEEKSSYYDAVMEQTAPIRETDDESVLFFGDDTWLWLSQKNEFSTASTWMNMMPEYNQIGYMEKQKQYFERFPEKRPKYIFVSSKNNLLKSCFDPGRFVAFFGLENADIAKSENGYLINTSKLFDE